MAKSPLAAAPEIPGQARRLVASLAPCRSSGRSGPAESVRGAAGAAAGRRGLAGAGRDRLRAVHSSPRSRRGWRDRLAVRGADRRGARARGRSCSSAAATARSTAAAGCVSISRSIRTHSWSGLRVCLASSARTCSHTGASRQSASAVASATARCLRSSNGSTWNASRTFAPRQNTRRCCATTSAPTAITTRSWYSFTHAGR